MADAHALACWPVLLSACPTPTPSHAGLRADTVCYTSQKSFGMSINAFNLVCNTAPGGLAVDAGIKKGDRLLSFNGDEVTNEEALFAAMLAVPHGTECVFDVTRKGDLPEGNAA